MAGGSSSNRQKDGAGLDAHAAIGNGEKLARRRRKGRGHRSKAIPIAPLVPVGAVALNAYQTHGLSKNMLVYIGDRTTGYNADNGVFTAADAMPFWTGEIMGIIVHKVANKTGLNKYIRKATMGWLVL